jgi:hypothetical protein
MSDVSSVAMATATAAGVTLFGVSTGLDPSLLIAGFAGGLWAQSYSPAAHWLHRLAATALAAILAGYVTPAAAAVLAASDTIKGALPGQMLQLPVAVLVGLLAQRVLGPAIMRLARKKSEDLTK